LLAPHDIDEFYLNILHPCVEGIVPVPARGSVELLGLFQIDAILYRSVGGGNRIVTTGYVTERVGLLKESMGALEEQIDLRIDR
jgi:hypothetical protein